MISAKPMMAFKGVRSSRLILARNSDLARLAPSAWFFALTQRLLRPLADDAARASRLHLARLR